MPQTRGGCEDFKSTARCADKSISTQPTLSLELLKFQKCTRWRSNPPSQDGDRVCINMVDAKIDIATHSRDYGSSKSITSLEAPPPPLEMNLWVEKSEPLPHIPKGVLKNSTHNPNARATQNYSIIEYMGQTPCTMLALEVLQTCPSHRNALLFSL
jgi:hypothetical protein